MKFLYIAQHIYPPLGGAEHSTIHLIEHLREQGHTCEYVCQTNYDTIDIVEKAKECDILLTQLAWTPNARMLSKELNKPLVYFFHSWEYICNQGHDGITASNCDHKCGKCLHRNKNFDADLVVSNSIYIQQLLSNEHKLDSILMYPHIDYDKVAVESRTPKYITMPRVHYMKGTDRFLKIAECMPEHKFRIVGYGNMTANCPTNVTLAGHMEPKEFYKDTSVWVVPSRFESFGLTIVEAQYNNIPVVASNVGAAKEDDAVKIGAVIKNPDDISEWVRHLENITKNLDRYYMDTLSELIKKEFDRTELINHFIQRCETLI